MRKALSLVIAVSLLLSMVPAAISSAAETELIWQETFDGPAEEITKSWSISKNGETKLDVTVKRVNGKLIGEEYKNIIDIWEE